MNFRTSQSREWVCVLCLQVYTKRLHLHDWPMIIVTPGGSMRVMVVRANKDRSARYDHVPWRTSSIMVERLPPLFKSTRLLARGSRENPFSVLNHLALVPYSLLYTLNSILYFLPFQLGLFTIVYLKVE